MCVSGSQPDWTQTRGKVYHLMRSRLVFEKAASTGKGFHIGRLESGAKVKQDQTGGKCWRTVKMTQDDVLRLGGTQLMYTKDH